MKEERKTINLFKPKKEPRLKIETDIPEHLEKTLDFIDEHFPESLTLIRVYGRTARHPEAISDDGIAIELTIHNLIYVILFNIEMLNANRTNFTNDFVSILQLQFKTLLYNTIDSLKVSDMLKTIIRKTGIDIPDDLTKSANELRRKFFYDKNGSNSVN